MAILLLLQPLVPAHAIPPQSLAPLAERVSKDLSRAKLKSAIVFLFSGPGKEQTELGRQLAEEFAVAIRAGDKPLFVIERENLAPHIQKHGLEEYLGQLYVACWLAEQAGAKALISGALEVRGKVVRVNVQSFATSECRRVSNQNIELALDDQRRALLAQLLSPAAPPNPDSPTSPYPGTVRAGEGNTTFAICRNCPNPGYTEEARRAGLNCTVLLRAIITKEGQAEQIQIARPCPLGLTEKATEAVQTWRFKPARGPDGSPVIAWTPIEISFRIHWGSTP